MSKKWWVDALVEHNKNRLGIKHHNWKGEDAGYVPKHMWIKRHYGKADHCEECNVPAKRYEWANISRKYIRDITDFRQLCTSCHKKYDFTEETRAKMRIAAQARPKRNWNLTSVKQFSNNGVFINKFNSVKEASKATGILTSSIHNQLSGRAKTAGGYIWKTN